MTRKNIRTANMPDQDLIEKIRQEVNNTTKTENFPDSGKSFVLWILKNYFDLDGEIAATSVIDSPNDKRVDAFIEGETIKIMQ